MNLKSYRKLYIKKLRLLDKTDLIQELQSFAEEVERITESESVLKDGNERASYIEALNGVRENKTNAELYYFFKDVDKVIASLNDQNEEGRYLTEEESKKYRVYVEFRKKVTMEARVRGNELQIITAIVIGSIALIGLILVRFL